MLVDLDCPVRRGRLEPVADEAQRGHREDRIAQPYRELDEDRSHHVREDLDEHDVRPSLAAELRGLDVIELPFGEDSRPHRACDQRREDDPDEDDDRHLRRAERHGDGHGEDDQGQRENRVDHAADHIVHHSPVIADDETDQRAEHGAEDRRERGHDEDVARPGAHPGEDVAADLVRAEPVGRVRVGEHLLARREGVVGREPLADDGAADPEEEDRGADEEGPRAEKQVAHLGTTALRADLEGGGGLNERLVERAHSAAYRMRGLRTP